MLCSRCGLATDAPATDERWAKGKLCPVCVTVLDDADITSPEEREAAAEVLNRAVANMSKPRGLRVKTEDG